MTCVFLSAALATGDAVDDRVENGRDAADNRCENSCDGVDDAREARAERVAAATNLAHTHKYVSLNIIRRFLRKVTHCATHDGETRLYVESRWA